MMRALNSAPRMEPHLPRRVRYSDLVVSSLNQELVYPDNMLDWLKPQIRRSKTDHRDVDNLFNDHLPAGEALAQIDSEMNPDATSTFYEARRTGPKTEHNSMNYADLNPLHSKSSNCSATGNNLPLGKEAAPEESSETMSESLYDKLKRFWICYMNKTDFLNIVEVAHRSRGSMRKRRSRLAYGFRKKFREQGQGIKLPYRFLVGILGSELSIVQRASIISFGTDDFLLKLKELKKNDSV